MNLVDFLKEKTSGASSCTALYEVDSAQSVTYGQMWSMVGNMSNNLTELGLQQGDKVVLSLPNGINWVVAFLSIIKIGATVIPLRQSSTSAEAKYLVSSIKPDMFIGDSDFINRSLPFDLLDEHRVVGILAKKILKKTDLTTRIFDIDELLLSKESASLVPDRLNYKENCEALISFTYRGYGYPLGAIHTHYSLIEGVKAYSCTAEFNSQHTVLSFLPYCYIYPLLGCLLSPLATKSKIIIYNGVSPHTILKIIEENHVDVLTAVPSVYSALNLLKRSEHDISSISYAFCGGSPMSQELYNDVDNIFGIKLRQGYGLTESLPITCNSSLGNNPSSIGTALFGADKPINICIVDENFNRLPVGAVGEIAVSSPTLMTQYYNSAEETLDVMKDGFMRTGDLGFIDKDGYVYFRGLKKRISKVGGNMVDLKEVEARIALMRGVSGVKAYSVPDDRWGAVIGVDIFADDLTINQKTVRLFLKNYLSSYKIPKIVTVTT